MYRVAIASALALLLAACGGSSSSDSSPAPQPPAPQPPPAPVKNDALTSATLRAPVQISQQIGAESAPLVDVQLDLKWKAAAGALYAQFEDKAAGVGRAEPIQANLIGDTSAQIRIPVPDKPVGTYRGTVAMKLCPDAECKTEYAPSTVSVPYEIVILGKETPPAEAARKLLPSLPAVALTAVPGATLTSRELTIGENTFQQANWTASSNQSWLTVTGSGATGGKLTISANPASLPNNAISYATVTVTSATSGVANAEPIKVALWKGSANAPASAEVRQPYVKLVADPLRPLVYAHNGSGAIDVYNVYTAARTGSIPNVGAGLGTMAVSPDGSRLYVIDTASRTIRVNDLSTLANVSSWPLSETATDDTDLITLRPNGVEVVLTGEGQAFFAGRGAAGTFSTGFRPGHYTRLAVDASGRKLVTYDTDAAPWAMRTTMRVSYADLNGGTLRIDRLFSQSGSGFAGYDIAMVPDGSATWLSTWESVCTDRLEPEGGAAIQGRGGNVEVGSDGRVYCSSRFFADVGVRNGDESRLLTLPVGILTRQLRVSADGRILAMLHPVSAVPPYLSFVRVDQ